MVLCSACCVHITRGLRMTTQDISCFNRLFNSHLGIAALSSHLHGAQRFLHLPRPMPNLPHCHPSPGNGMFVPMDEPPGTDPCHPVCGLHCVHAWCHRSSKWGQRQPLFLSPRVECFHCPTNPQWAEDHPLCPEPLGDLGCSSCILSGCHSRSLKHAVSLADCFTYAFQMWECLR